MSSKKTIDGLETINTTGIESYNTLPISINGVNVTDFTSVGPIVINCSAVFTNASIGSGSNVTAIHYTTQSSTSINSVLTYAASSTNGDTWTINQAGIYCMRIGNNGITGGSGQGYYGISRNVSATTGTTSWTQSQIIIARVSESGFENSFTTTSGTCLLNANDVVRHCWWTSSGGPPTSVGSGTWFEITYIGGTASTL